MMMRFGCSALELNPVLFLFFYFFLKAPKISTDLSNGLISCILWIISHLILNYILYKRRHLVRNSSDLNWGQLCETSSVRVFITGMGVTVLKTQENSPPSEVSPLYGPAASSHPLCCSSCSWTAPSDSSPLVTSPPVPCAQCSVCSSSSVGGQSNVSFKLCISLAATTTNNCKSYLDILQADGQRPVSAWHLLFLLLNFPQRLFQLLFLSLLTRIAAYRIFIYCILLML